MIEIIIDKPSQISGQKSLYIYCEELTVISHLMQFKPAYYHAKSKEWELPYTLLAKVENCFQINNLKYEVQSVFQDDEFNFDFKTKPFQHQIEFYQWAKTRNVLFLGDEQGLGKTKQAIDFAVYKKQYSNYKHCLIIVGVNGLKFNWQEEVEKHSNEKAFVLGQRFITKGVNKGQIRDGSTQERMDDIKRVPEEYFWVVNIETLRDKKISTELKKMCEKGIISMCIADEIHKMKNPTCEQGKGFLKLKPECRLALTGTPLMNCPLDVFVILKWLDVESHCWTDFKNQFAVFDGFGSAITGYKNLNQLRQMINSIMLRRLKKEVLDLPEKIHSTEYVEMGEAQRKIYLEVLQKTREEIDKIKLSPNPLAQMTRLRQATGHTAILSSTVSESVKLVRLRQIIQDCIENDDKVIVFSEFKEVIQRIYSELSAYKPALITGDVTSGRQEEVNRFQNNANCKVILGTTKALGTGYTLTAASTVVFIDSPWNKANKDQAEDRAHRIGTKGTVNVITLVCKNTVDEKIEKLVQGKGEMSDMLIDGKVQGRVSNNIIDYLLV